MKQVEMYSIAELLATPTFNNNQRKLSKFLKMHRTTVYNHKNDFNCENHCVLKIDGKYVFRVVPKNRKAQNPAARLGN